MNPFPEKLALLRGVMKENNIEIYIIPSTDPHLGEYVPDHWNVIDWLVGFTGSAATVVITAEFAGLWTDSRYFKQAENQLYGTGCTLMKPELPDKKDFIGWLSENIKAGSKVGLDGRTFSITLTRKMEKQMEGKKVSFDFYCDLISDIWADRPPMPTSTAFDHPVMFCGKDRTEKIIKVREEMKIQNLHYHLLTSVDDIMWLLNIRGNDVQYSPLLTSYAIVGEEQILLFTDEKKISMKLASEFDKLDVVILPYDGTSNILSTLSAGSSILITPGTTSVSLFNSLNQDITIIEDISIPSRLKAIKNRVEIQNIGKVMIKDGVALTRFFYWIEQNSDLVPMSELSLTKKLNDLRSEQEHYLGPSFSTIMAFNEHGALPHYTVTSDTDSVTNQQGILLIDSGGQYLDGTTDITRTISIGIPTLMQKKDFTLVLKGTINIAMAKFPSGTRGYQLDILARKALWENGLNYGHGTGHGVGFCLNVHEGPHNIGTGTGSDPISVIEPGMLFSDEPAIYREGEYGIRIENLILCYEDEETEYGTFLKFNTLSLCYIDKTLIDIDLLNKIEIGWLNTYHTEVFEKLSPYLTHEEKNWLKDKTSAF